MVISCEILRTLNLKKWGSFCSGMKENQILCEHDFSLGNFYILQKLSLLLLITDVAYNIEIVDIKQG